MCCCIFVFLPQYKKSVCFFSLLVFRPDTFSLSLFLCFPHPSLFPPSLFPLHPPPPHPLFSFPFSLSPPLSMFLLSCLVLDFAVVDHVNIFVPNSVHFGVVGFVLPLPLSHSGLFTCDMHFVITHLVPHHCTPALIVFMGDSHHNCRGGFAFSLA